jgi:hypothetical protein
MGAPTPDAGEADGPSSALRGRARPTIGRELVRTTFVTEESVYGIILVSGMIVVAGSGGVSAVEVFWKVLGTVVVFWAAHLYAGTVSRHGLEEGHVIGLRHAFRASFRQSLGLLASAIIPLLILLLGATKAIDDTFALWCALWAGVGVLAVLGWIAFTRRGASWPVRVAGSLATAAFGVAMIVLKAFIH